jgi:CBS-domain-containing membrane protein
MGWCTASTMVFPLVLSRETLNQSMQALDCRAVMSLLLSCTQKSTGIDQASGALVHHHVGALHKGTFT